MVRKRGADVRWDGGHAPADSIKGANTLGIAEGHKVTARAADVCSDGYKVMTENLTVGLGD